MCTIHVNTLKKMKQIQWNDEKNKQLQAERNLSFEAIVVAIEQGKLIDITPHPSQKYKNQNVMIVEIDDYLVFVPFIEDEEKIFLKTAFRSRKIMRNLRRKTNHETT